MRKLKKSIAVILALTMSAGTLTLPALAEETVTESVVSDNNMLTEPFDVTYEDEVDAGLYPYDEKTVLVKLAKKATALEIDGISGIEYLFKAKDGFWYTANLSDGTTPKDAIESLRNSGKVLLAEYNFLYEAGATTLCDGEGFYDGIHDNPRHSDQWYLDSCGLQKSWKKIKDDGKNPGGDSSIVVAVIDTGVDYDHEDLKNNMWVNTGEIPGDGIDNDGNGYVDDYYGVDIVAKKGNGDDDHGHGTHVAGIIAAANNHFGVVGIAYNAKIMAIKAGQASGYFLQTDVCKAINYARENGADVINMSFGGSASTIAVQDALEEAYTHSVLVAAAGNDSAPNEPPYSGDSTAKPCYPAAYSFVLGVMSVDNFGVESGFTNYDVKGYNDVEYELYAPGNAITSTIPNNKYATWNGTSMAAPIVSGMAAVLRSVYNDPDKYPTKFIYGQLASTSDRHAICVDSRSHGAHNLPQIVNLYSALTKMPKPEVSMSDYTTFDTSDISSKNNGDGTIDAGETISLGFELRNRWGMSEDTVVTVDALSPAGIPNPYVEFSSDGKKFSDSASVNYGSVGTYSTQDCGKVIKDDLWTGWEKPFYLKISKDAPNETILAINVNIACKNALDENDKHTYSSSTSINLVVKNGVVLPQVIDKDMTLTKDNYYIIPNSTVIEEGATVTVTEGTNIQFWTNDKTDPYADKYMASLVVNGKLNCVGTEEEPVKIFPSDLMGNYRVEIYERGNGEINYSHTDITNLYTDTSTNLGACGFTKAENCEFSQNYKDTLYYRYLNGGKVETSYYRGYIRGTNAENCAFYKLGGSSKYYNSQNTYLFVNCENCIFVDSAIDFQNNYTYNNCVFYGNNNYWDSKSNGITSSMSPKLFDNCANISKIVRNEKTGTTYIEISLEDWTSDAAGLNTLAEYLGGHLVYIETAEELDFLSQSELQGLVGAKFDHGRIQWLNGEVVGDFIVADTSNSYTCIELYGKILRRDNSTTAIIELSDEIRIEEISLPKTNISLDTSATYQLTPQIYPSTACGQKLLYFSSNEAIAKVDENGLVTPVDVGTATIYVFSEDMQVKTSTEINVKAEVRATSVSAPENMQINIGETKALNAVVKPSNTTKQLKYKSADESIATVDADGNITAKAKGETVITAYAENGEEIVSADTAVSVVVPVESVEFESRMVYCRPGETKAVAPVITPDNATNQNLVWDSSNPEVCYVNESGELVGVAEGLATLKVTAENTEISAYVTVCVNDEVDTSPEVTKIRPLHAANVDLCCIVTDDGQLWQMGKNDSVTYVNPVKIDLSYNGEKIEVADIAFPYYDDYPVRRCLILDKAGNLYSFITDWLFRYPINFAQSLEKIAENVTGLIPDVFNGRTCAAIKEDGSVLVMGSNSVGQLGIGGNGQSVKSPISVSVDGERVVDGYNYNNSNSNACIYLLTESGNLYVAGYYNGTTYEYFEKIYEGVDRIDNSIAYTADGYINLQSTPIKLQSIQHENMVDVNMYLEDGKVYYNSSALNLNSVKKVLPVYGRYYYVTERNDLYYTSDSNPSGATVPQYVTMSPISIEEAPALRENDTNLTEPIYDEAGNITSAVLKENELVLGFSENISASSAYNNIALTGDGTQLGIKRKCDLNDLTVTLGGGFKEGVEYTLTIPANAFMNDASLSNGQITVAFTYQPKHEEETVEPTPEPEEPETPEEPGEEKHVHSFATETVMPTSEENGKITNTCECGVVTETILPKLTARKTFTAEEYAEKYNEFIAKGYNTNVFGSAILNRLIDDDVTKWLRITAPEGGQKYGFGGNYWGTTNSELINHQIVDYNDFITLGDINEGEILTEAPENTFPFVTEAYVLDESDEVQSIVSGGKVKFVVKFNRDMDTEKGVNVYFGSAYPYADYEIDGEFTDSRTWVGETTLKTVIENGYQFIRVANGRTAADEKGEHLKLYTDWARFGFEIDTTSAMAMMMQGYADNDGIRLEWMQDDYDTLAGYNVYRADSENGNYVRINKTVIPSDENTYVDTDVEPGKKYYYTFTVVLTDVSSESKPAGKISINAKDTMAPNVYHSPVYTAVTGSKVIISATVSDNIGVQNAKLYYRVKGSEEWKVTDMTSSNDKYTAAIPAAAVTLDGVEYYIAAFDGVNYTYAGGHTSENPYEITVYQAVESNAKGDVDGDGNITVLDALKLLRAIYDESLLTQEEFLRADINGDGKLSAVEALRILQYANHAISSVLW